MIVAFIQLDNYLSMNSDPIGLICVSFDDFDKQMP